MRSNSQPGPLPSNLAARDLVVQSQLSDEAPDADRGGQTDGRQCASGRGTCWCVKCPWVSGGARPLQKGTSMLSQTRQLSEAKAVTADQTSPVASSRGWRSCVICG